MKTFKQFQEGVAALKVGSKLLPKLMIGVGAGGTLFKAQEYIKKKFRPKEKKDRAGEFWDDVPDSSKDKTKTPPAQPEMGDDINTPLVDKENKFGGKGKPIDAKTRKRMNAPENQFNSYNPLGEEAPIVNNVGDGKIAGTVEAGDDPPVNKKKKKCKPPIMARGKLPGARSRFKGGVELIASLKKNKYT